MTRSPGPADFGLGSWPARRARISPGRPALVRDGRTLTHAGLADRVDRLAGALTRLGVRPGDRVAYLGVNDISVFETLFATARRGAVFVPLNYRLSGAEIRYMLEDSGASVLVHSPDADDLLAAAAPLPETLRHVVATNPASCPADGLDFEAELAAAGPAPETAVRLEDPCLLLYTSGTTGRPKAAVLTHGNLTWNTVNQLAHLDVLSTDKALCIAPLFHCVGLGQITLPTLFKGGSVEPVAKFDPGAILGRIGEAGITSFSAVPTMLEMMCRHESWDDTDLSSLTCVLYGGSPVAERVARAWLDRGVKLLQGYGMTEAAPGVTMATHDGTLDHPVAAGVPHFFTDVAALGPDLAPAPLGAEPAELLVRGPHVFGGYWDRPEESAASFVEDEWFRTGDVVRVEEDGWAHVVDRVKDLIISGGENVYPAEIEAVAARLDEVDSCAVVGVPDERWGEAGAAFVVLRPGARLDAAAFRAHLERHLARYKIPKHVQFTETLPRNATGKIRRVELRALATATFSNGPA
ncbi:acyl-CoA synthetase [Amycolatopsis nalaikhensis]|uniref:Long-chain fatty acid--CoA ligase n=1 Tax=Amycolatopsis nalaikhensis TaxID=715472 RepID=A0ABY8XJU0_9PSEU|nr:long-chain fatty acid--CoA ligase [Amycolatopsis sp. 2-2]WIV55857.1 long-chain fatty acid--CoA ligase [Amycolatopsis sp. 2-2]